ncbi:MAG: hypothetical protein K9N23_04745 [Akkermansiaceae bacterium]|nr:hypothetical protein [Akkermansiaceae bacterium]MCF7730969.1 hypothetical protein [Akkermansiaceae bacterium]
MKNLLMLVSLVAVSLGFSSCCSMFGSHTQNAGYRTETKQVKTCGYDIITEEVVIPGDAKSGKGGMVQIKETKVPRYKTVTKKVRIPCGKCARFYCPKKDCCGSTSQATINMSSAQGPVGSPHIGLIPTMKKIAP